MMKQHEKTSSMMPNPTSLRRTDLTPMIRIYIACTALIAQHDKRGGVITHIARQFLISRMFVYLLAAQVKQTSLVMFAPLSTIAVGDNDRFPYRCMLSLRMEGRWSIGAISTIMKRFHIELSSGGMISQTLQAIGALLPNTLPLPQGMSLVIVFVSDEVFANGWPILVTVEPQSSVVLRIELVPTCQWEHWQHHWECLEDNGYYALYLVSDGGQALTKAQKETLKDRVRQPDTYHAIAHRFGRLVHQLERSAYAAIDKEASWQKKLRLATTKSERQRVRTQMTRAETQMKKAIDLYEDCAYLYTCLVEELQVFDATGRLRSREEAEGNIEAALDLLETLEVDAVTKAAQHVRRTLPELFQYFDQAQFVVAQLHTLPLEPETLQALCRAWQWHKQTIKAKSSRARRYCAVQEQAALAVAESTLQPEYESIKARVYQQLDQIVQSSSLVECLNSLIRPYLDMTRNHVTQELLNLIMFYHNHRRYTAGKRKGKTPMEWLTGTPQEHDWLDMLFEYIDTQQPDFFTSSR